MGPVERSIRRHLVAGAQLRTPARGAPFTVGKVDEDGLVLLLGAGGWSTPFTWAALEGIVPFLRERGSVDIGSKYDVEGLEGTLDGYLKKFMKRATAAWIAAALERSGVVEVLRARPMQVRLNPQWEEIVR